MISMAPTMLKAVETFQKVSDRVDASSETEDKDASAREKGES